MICRTGKIGGTHVYFKTCWEDIITAGMADPFCDRPRACLKNHSRNLHAPLCGIFCPNSVAVARYGALIRTKSPTNCDAHLAESLFQTRSSSEDDSTDLCGCQGNPWVSIYFVDYSDCILLP